MNNDDLEQAVLALNVHRSNNQIHIAALQKQVAKLEERIAKLEGAQFAIYQGGYCSMPKPEHICPSCQQYHWTLREDGSWGCSLCNPVFKKIEVMVETEG